MSWTAYNSPLPNKAPVCTIQFVTWIVKLLSSFAFIFEQQIVTSLYMSAQMRNVNFVSGILIYFHIRCCCLSGIQELFPHRCPKHLQCCRQRNRALFSLRVLACRNGPAEETSRSAECLVDPALSLYKDGLYCILQNRLIKAVAKSVWHLGFFFAPSKVNWSSAADFNEKSIRH